MFLLLYVKYGNSTIVVLYGNIKLTRRVYKKTIMETWLETNLIWSTHFQGQIKSNW